MLEMRTAGDPDDEDLIYTDLTPPEMAREAAQLGTAVSPPTVTGWLKECGVRLRKIDKRVAGGESVDRDTQFTRIHELIAEYESSGNPWFSIDTKAKEHLGQLYRQGRAYSSRAVAAYDHDFPSWADGVLIPHGIYDRVLNIGHINLGLSHDTTQFACASVWRFWQRFGRSRYPTAKSILLTCDCGGSNSANKHIFKYDLQCLAGKIGLPIRIAHYPSYCSKYNPIERRFFSQVSRVCQGKLFETLDRALELMRRTATSTGLRTTVHVLEKLYQTGRKVTDEMLAALKIQYDAVLPKWNYIAHP